VTETRLNWSQQLMVMLYEELSEDPMGHVRAILNYVGLEEDPERMRCLDKSSTGRVKGKQRDHDPFTVQEKILMSSAIDDVKFAARLRGVQLPDYVSTLDLNMTKTATQIT
ncbi:unnamed protein product, partial [Meganyctiphanes norvegica]